MSNIRPESVSVGAWESSEQVAKLAAAYQELQGENSALRKAITDPMAFVRKAIRDHAEHWNGEPYVQAALKAMADIVTGKDDCPRCKPFK